MLKKKLGNSELSISEVGLGCMSMAGVYGRRDKQESLATLRGALNAGVNFFDTADLYGGGRNESLISDVLKTERDRVVIATKFGFVLNEKGMPTGEVNGTPEYVRQCAEASLSRLGVDVIDLYYQHRTDPDVPIEETVGAMSDLVKEGKVRALGLSEASPNTIRRAAKVHEITAVQTEYSLFVRDIEKGVLDATREVGASFVAYSPLVRGLLSGVIKTKDDLLARSKMGGFLPLFSEAHADNNYSLIKEVIDISDRVNTSVPNVAIAWLLSRGSDIIPIVGCSKLSHLLENIGALTLSLSEEDKQQLDSLASRVAGERYDDANLKATSVETPEPA